MSTQAQVLLDRLGHGQRAARSAQDLAAELGVSERKVGELAVDLIDAGCLIGSTCDADHHGYFVIVTEQDLEVGTRHIRARALASLHRLSTLRKAAAARFTEADLTLFDMEESA